jgi:hypothetical protein
MRTELTLITVEPVERSPDEAEWTSRAACSEPGAPSMFADDWGVGRSGRRRRAIALACCRRCAVRQNCGLQALVEVEAGLCLYGVRCGIEFTDVTPSRQQRDVERLRAAVAGVAEPSIVAQLRLVDAQSRRAAGQPVASVDEPALAITA